MWQEWERSGDQADSRRRPSNGVDDRDDVVEHLYDAVEADETVEKDFHIREALRQLD